SWSAFGDTSYKLTDRFTLGVGVRYFKDSQEFASGFGFGAPPFLGAAQIGHFHSVDPRFYAQYKLTNDVNLYTRGGKGFRCGGFNFMPDQPAFDPESVWTYELGTKSSWPQARARADMDVFYSKYSDYVISGVTAQSIFFPISSNAGDAVIKGVEADV